jgi:hypothetical protein
MQKKDYCECITEQQIKRKEAGIWMKAFDEYFEYTPDEHEMMFNSFNAYSNDYYKIPKKN